MKNNRKTKLLKNELNEEKSRNTGNNAESAAMDEAPIDADTADSENEGAQEAHGSDYEQAAMLLGREMLDRIGMPDGINPIAVVIALLDGMDSDAESADISERENYSPDATVIPPESTENFDRLPMPMRGSIGKAQETDYSEMSREDFMKLRRQLQKASMDGRRVRI